MNMTNHSVLSKEALSTAGELMQATLIDLVAVSLQCKQVHWSVTGPNFREIHQQLDEVHAVAAESADEIAERMSTIGVAPDGRAITIVNDSGLVAIPNGFLSDQRAVELIVTNLERLCRGIRTRFERMGSVDLVSQDVLIGVCRNLEKQLWMLQAHIVEAR